MKADKNKIRTYTIIPNIKPIILLLPNAAQTPIISNPLAPTPLFMSAPGLTPLKAGAISSAHININNKTQILNKYGFCIFMPYPSVN